MKNNIEKHLIIIIPGLGNNTTFLKLLLFWWRLIGLQPYIYNLDWKNDSLNIKNEIDKILALGQKLKMNSKVSIIGISAGGSLALNVFMTSPECFDKITTVCSRLNVGPIDNFKLRSKKSKLFQESVIICENAAKDITYEISKKIMTITAKFGDELVPKSCSVLEIYNVRNLLIPSFEHIVTITLALTVLSKKLTKFLKEA